MMFKNLLSPIQIGSLELKNRVVMAPLGTGFYNHGAVSQREKSFHKSRAEGGVGLILTSAASVGRPPNPEASVANCHGVIYDDKFIPGWTELVKEIHDFDAKIGMQLTHFGRQIPSKVWGGQPVSSSAIACPVCRSTPRELILKEIEEIIHLFADAARRCKEAGMDLVEIHGAHGYLGTQFLSPYMNHRADEYGGNAEGRTKFVREIIQRTKRRCGQDFIVGVRINGQDNIKGGATIEDAKEVARWLEKAGADFLHVSATVYGGYPPISPMEEPPGCYVHLAEAVKSEVRIPVIAVGRIDSPQLAEEILKEKKADLVAIGRPLLADPEWVNKAAAGRADTIRKCIYCNQGCLDRINDINLEGKRTSITCLVNPEVGKEEAFKIRSALKRKRVVVVGGGPAGLEAARVASARGHEVILFEKEKELGGQFLLASIPPTKGHYREAIDHLVREVVKFGVEIRLHSEGVAQSVAEVNPDAVVIATGAIPLVPKIPGVESKHVATYDKVFLGRFEAEGRVLIVGGGLVGLETADFLSSQGREVQVVEMENRFAGEMGKVARFALRRRLSERGVKLFKSCKVTRILDRGVEVLEGDQNKTMDGFHTVVLAVGMQPRDALFQQLKERIDEVYLIGDALKPRNALEAIYEGAEVGRKI